MSLCHEQLKYTVGGLLRDIHYKAPSQINALQSKITFAICPYLPLRLIFFLFFLISAYFPELTVGLLDNFLIIHTYDNTFFSSFSNNQTNNLNQLKKLNGDL